MYSDLTIQKLNDVAHTYAPLIHQSIHAVLSQPRYRNTGAGVDSLTVEVVDGTSSKAPRIIINFDDRLLFMDKRRMQWTKLPDMKEMVAWAETKTGTRLEAEALAWGTAIKQKKFDTWKPKPWRKKSLSGVLRQMNKMVREAWDKVIEQEVVTTFNKAA